VLVERKVAESKSLSVVRSSGRGVQRLPGGLARQLPGRQPAQFGIDQEPELVGGVGVALLDRGQDAGDSGHH
jgi:hypothetical protein